MKIELLYLMDCPWCIKTKKLVRETLGELKLKAEVKEILIDTKTKANKYGFIGSPTVRINGKDIQSVVERAKCLCCEELSELAKNTTSFVKKESHKSGCRVYKYKGKTYPYPPKRLIKEALKRFQHRPSPALV